MSSAEIPEQVAKLMKETGTNITNPKDLEALSKVSVRQLAKLFDELAKNSRASNLNKKSTADIFRSWTKAVVEQFHEGGEEQKKRVKTSAEMYLDRQNQILTDNEMKERREELVEIEGNIAKANAELDKLKVTLKESAAKNDKSAVEQIKRDMEDLKTSKRGDIEKSDKRKDVAFYKTIFYHKKRDNLVRKSDDDDKERDEDGKTEKEFVEDSLFQDKWNNAGGVDETTVIMEMNPSDCVEEAENKFLRSFGTDIQGTSSKSVSSSSFKCHKKGKKHPVVIRTVLERVDEEGVTRATITARCAGEFASNEIKENIEQSMDSLKEAEAAEAEKRYQSYDDRTETTSNIPLAGTKRLVDAWERMMQSVATDKAIYPVYTRGGREKGRSVMLGSDYKKHPVVLRADLKNDGGVYSLDLSCKTPVGEEEEGKVLMEAVESVLFETGFDFVSKLNQSSLEVIVPGIPDVDDAVKRLIDGAGSQPVGGDHSTKTGELHFISKKNKRHPVFMKAVLDEDDDRVKIHLTLCGDDKGVVDEIAKGMKESVEREEDPAERFADEWDLTEENESHRIIDLNGEQNVDEATENFIQNTGIQVVGVVQQEKNDRLINFYGKNGTKKHPVLMRATIKRDEEGVVVADLKARGPSKKEIRADLDSLKESLASNDPLARFESEFENLGESSTRKEDIQIPRVSTLIDMFEKMGKAADSKPFVNRSDRKLGHIGFIGKKNPEHPVYMKGKAVKMEDGSYVAQVETRCNEEHARCEFLNRLKEDLFDNDWNKYGAATEKAKSVEMLADNIEDSIKQLSDATQSFPTSTRVIGNKTTVSIYGKRQGKHPIMMKAEIEQKSPGVFHTIVKARSDDNQFRDEMTSDVVTQLDPITTFDKVWDENKGSERADVVNLPNVRSLIEAFERLGKAADVPVAKRPGKVGQCAFFAKKNHKHPVLIKANVRENTDGTFSTELSSKSEDQQLLKVSIDELQDSLFQNEWQRLGEDLESFNQIEISGDSLDAAIRKVSNAAGTLPVGSIKTEGDKHIVSFYGKNNEKKPVLLRAEISSNGSGSFLAVVQARAEDEDARDEVSLGLKELLERGEDPASVFQDSWDQLHAHHQELTPYDLYSNDLNAATDKLIDDLSIIPAAPVNRDGEKNAVDFHGRDSDKPVLLRALIDKDGDGNVQVQVSGRSESADALSLSLKDVQEILESKDPNNVFEKQWESLGEDKQHSNHILFPNVKSLVDAMESLIHAANTDPIRRREDKKNGKCAFLKKTQKHPILIKAKVSEREPCEFVCTLEARSELPQEDILKEIDSLGRELFNNAWAELGEGATHNKVVPFEGLDIDNILEILSKETTLTPIGDLRKGHKSLNLMGKMNKKHPLLLKAEFTKDTDGNVICCLSSVCDDESERLEAVGNIDDLLEKISNPLFRAALAKSNQFSNLGIPHKSSEPEMMTKKDDDIAITVIKHAFKDNAVIEIACKPIDPLETKLDYTKVSFGNEGTIRPVKQSTTKNGTGFNTFAEMGGVPGDIEGTLVTLATTNLKSGESKKSIIPLDIITITPGDFVRDSIVNFDKRWEELGENFDNEYITQFDFSTKDDVKSAVPKTIEYCPLMAINKDDKIDGDKHILKFSGAAPKRDGIDPNVLMQCTVYKDPEGNISLMAVCRSEDEVARVDIPEELIQKLRVNKSKLESDLFRDILSQHPKIAELGVPHKSSSAIHLLSNIDYRIAVTKHSYAEHVVLQFDYQNQASASELNNILTKCKEGNPFINDRDGLFFEKAIKTGVTPTGSTSYGFIRLKKVESSHFASGTFLTHTKFESQKMDSEVTRAGEIATVELDLSPFKMYTMDYLANKHVDDVAELFKSLENESCKRAIKLERLSFEEVRDRVLRAACLNLADYEAKGIGGCLKFSGELVDGEHVLLEAVVSPLDEESCLIELTGRSTVPLLRENFVRDVEELIKCPLVVVIEEKDNNGQEESRKGRKPLLDYKVDLASIPEPKWLKPRFNVLKYDPKKKWSSKAKRVWELDFFGGQFKNMDTKGVIKKCPEPAKLYHLERTPSDATRVRMNFFESSHKYELVFDNNFQRERFYECAHALRPTFYVWCPNICAPGETRCRAEISGSFNFDSLGVQQKVTGSCHINVTSKPYETISVWCGTWNMGGTTPPKDPRLMRKYIPANKHDIYAIAVQDSGYSKDRNAFIGYLQGILGKSEYVVLTFLTLWDIQLCIAVRKRHFTKITNVQSEQRPTQITSAGTKGGVGVSLTFNETSFCFISSHLVPNSSDDTPNRFTDNSKTRNLMIEDILGNLKLGNKSLDINGQFHHVFLLGDLNYRIEIPAEEALPLISSGQYDQLIEKDELRQEMSSGKVLCGFKEADIKFQPTFKFEKATITYDTKKPITPSYCDRILWKSMANNTVTCVDYKACTDLIVSDHLPVSAVFKINTIRPYASTFAKEQETCQIIFDSIKVKHREATKENQINKPTLSFYAPFIDDNIVAATKQPKAYNPEFLASMIPIIEPSTGQKDFLKLQHLVIALTDGLSKDNTDNLQGTALLPLKNGLDSTNNVTVTLDLVRFGKKVGDVEVTYKYVFRQKQQSNDGSLF